MNHLSIELMLLIYKRYITANILSSLFFLSFVVTTIVWVTQILKLLYLIDKGVALNHFLHLVILIIPSLLFIILPFITALAVIYTYNRFSEDRQLITLQNAGLSNFSLAKPALMIALVITIFSYYIAAYLLPASHIKLKSDLNLIKDNYISKIVSEKTFNQISKLVTIYVDKKLADGTIQGIVIFDNRDNSARPTIIFANTGNISINNGNLVFQLKKGSRQGVDKYGNFTKLIFESLLLEVSSDVKGDGRKLISRDINEYYIHELLAPDEELSEVKKNRLRSEGHQRLVWPLYNLILTITALSVFLKYPYNRDFQFKQLFYTATSVLIVTFLHFTLQNFASQYPFFLYIIYFNFLIAGGFAIWLFSCRTI